MSNFYQGKTVVVTGGAGFIGSHVVEQLVAAGAKVIVPLRTEQYNKVFLQDVEDKITIQKNTDLMQLQNAKQVTKDADVVMNVAARVGGITYNIENPGSIFRENMQVFMNVLEASRQNNVGRFLTVSSACVYPRHCSIPTPEEEGFDKIPEPTNEGYGWSKRMEEFLSRAYHKQYGMKIAIARPYNAYGPRDNFDPKSSHVIPAIIRRAHEGEDPFNVWGSGEQSRSFLYSADFAKGLLMTCEKYPEADPVNIGANEETKVKELVKIILELSGKNPKVEYDTTKPEGQPRRHCDTRKCEEKVGFKAETSLREGLQKTIEWFRKHGQ